MKRIDRLVVVGALVASVASAAERPKIIVLNLNGSDPSLQRLSETMSESLLTEMQKTGKVDAVGPGDLVAALGLERQKQMLGCSSEVSSCYAEISAAMGAPWVVAGAIQRLGKTVRVDLKLIRSKDGRAVYRDGRNIKDESDVFDVIGQMTRDLVASPALAADAVETAGGVSASGAAPSAGVAPWIVVGGGALAVAVGGFFCLQASSEWANVNSDAWRAAHQYGAIQSEGQAYGTNVVLGPSLVGAGAVAIAVGIVWRAAGASPAPVAVMPTHNGLAVGGVF